MLAFLGGVKGREQAKMKEIRKITSAMEKNTERKEKASLSREKS